MLFVRVGEAPFDVAAQIAALSANDNTGGVASYVGVVRDTTGRPLAALILESFPGMTERALQDLATSARDQFGLSGVVIEHRTGRLPPGAPIVLAACAAAHRHAALDAVTFLMDRLKTGAPFWKKEVFADGTEAWVDAKTSDDAAAARWTSPRS